MKQHGVVKLEDGTYEFWWFGARQTIEEFNGLVRGLAHQVADECASIARGMDMAQSVRAGADALAKLETLEEVLRLPLCASCKALIGHTGS